MRIQIIIDAPNKECFRLAIPKTKTLKIAMMFITDEFNILTVLINSIEPDKNDENTFTFSGNDFNNQALHGEFNTKLHSGWIEFYP